MRKLDIQMLAYAGAGQEVYDRGMELLEQYVPEDTFRFNHVNPDILFFITGGSEKEAIEACKHRQKIVLWSYEGENSNAAATEVKARLDMEGKTCFIWNIQNADFDANVHHLRQMITGIENLNNKQLGLVGEVSDWLVASDISTRHIKNTFGIDLVPIAWEALPAYHNCEPSDEFNQHFSTGNNTAVQKASRVHRLIQKIIHDNHLDAITVECFPLVRKNSVTACLSLALLNDNHIPAGCEGDLTSIIGMMFAKNVISVIPWMANTVKTEKHHAKFAHCTVPASMVNHYKITTHYETGLGTAIQGELKPETLTVFRFNNKLNKAFIAHARVIKRPQSNNACRTQIVTEMAENDLHSLRNNPLGNHLLFVPGDQRFPLQMAAGWMNMEIINAQ